MKELGILFRPNFALGGSTGVEDLLRDGYHAVFIGTGTWRPYQLHIPGETFGNVHYGINYLNNPDVYDLGDRVLVIGAGNAAMDVARTSIRKGSRHVTVYSITEVPAASPKRWSMQNWTEWSSNICRRPLKSGMKEPLSVMWNGPKMENW